jgi:pimeloyl-ACP methyl ester carboxylesterase
MSRIVIAVQVAFAWIVGLCWAVPVLIRLALTLVRHPISFWKTAHRRYPLTLQDPALGAHGTVVANGVKFHYLHRGSPTAPLLLCLHGFPEFSYSWRKVLARYGGAYHVVAVDLRGFGESEKPSGSWFGSKHYAMDTLVEDVRSLIVALGYTEATVLAHDWGGAIAWAFATVHPTMVSQLVVLNAPHPALFKRNATPAQFLRSWYIFLNQLPVLPELVYSHW